MRSISRIVVGVQMPVKRPWTAAALGDTTRAAIDQSLPLAAAAGAPITLVAALVEPSAGLFGSADTAAAAAVQDKAEAENVLRDVIEHSTAQQGHRLEFNKTVIFGQPWIEIVKAVDGDRDALVICGTRTRGAISRMLFGNTGLKLLRYAPCPVWLARPRKDYAAPLDVLAATDLTETGVEVLHSSVLLGQLLPMRLTALHVVDTDLDRHMARSGVSDEQVAAFRRDLREAAEQKLHEQLALTDHRTLPLGAHARVTEGNADTAILSAIEELSTDLLVMATATRGGFPGMLFGDTAERLLPELHCAILVIKPDDFQCPVKL